MQTFNQIERVYAGFWARAAAFVIDCIIVWFLRLATRFALFLSFGLFTGENPLDSVLLFQYTWKDGLLYAAGALYFVLFTYYTGATPGKKALNLRVVSADNMPLTFINVLFRETVGRFLSAFVLGLGYLAAGLTVEKKAFHDMLCDTRVIYAKKIPTYINGDINKRYVCCEEPLPAEKMTEPAAPCTAEDQDRDYQTQVFRMPPVQEIRTRDRNIRIYDRYVHVEPEKDKKKEMPGAEKEPEKDRQ